MGNVPDPRGGLPGYERISRRPDSGPGSSSNHCGKEDRPARLGRDWLIRRRPPAPSMVAQSHSETHLRQLIDWCLGNIPGRPEPQGKASVPIVEYQKCSTIGTDSREDLVEPPWKPSREEKAEIANLFPLPMGNDGKSVRPDMFELARVRREYP